MKTLLKLSYGLSLMLCLFISITEAQVLNPVDPEIAMVIKQQLARQQKNLHYPLSAARFYKQRNYKLAWIAPDTVKMHAGDAMILLDCVNQYGLNHADYHPKQLTYTQLELLTKQYKQASNLHKAQFDIWLTDAVITLINNLHYGRLNPDYPAGKIDAITTYFDGTLVLKAALSATDFSTPVTGAQPKSIAYSKLHHQMYLKTGLYMGDCYEFPEGDIRLMAINMDRLRWYNTRAKSRFELNIPSGVLTIHERDSNYYIKVKANALATMIKANTGFSITRIGVKVDKIILQLIPYQYKVGKESYAKFLSSDKAQTQGLSSVVISGKDKAIARLLSGQKQTGRQHLNITYLTCTIKNGELIKYPDLLNADKALQRVLYRTPL